MKWSAFILCLVSVAFSISAAPNIHYFDHTTQTTWFDELGRRTYEQDQAGKTTAFGYDTLGRLTAVTNAMGYVTSYTYNELGQQISQTDANLHTTTFEYDSMCRRVKRTLPDSQVETYAYNIGGQLTNRTDFNGYTTTYQYDQMNRVVAKLPDSRLGQGPALFAYNVLGLRTNMTDASGATAYAYDDRNRLAQKTKTFGGASYTSALNYSYDSIGNLTNILSSDPNGANVGYEYDALSRLIAVNDAKSGQTVYNYDEVENLKNYTYPNLIRSEYQYDSLNCLTNLSSSQLLTPVANYAYTVGAWGNRLTATEQLFASSLNSQPKTINRVYTYDSIYRLTGETINGAPASGTAGYNYDPVGNRLARNSTLPTLLSQNFSFDANDRLNTDTYDNNGNTLLGAGFGQTQTDQYDFENRLVARHTPQATINITYDGDGNRVSKTVTTATNTVTTFYVVDDLNPSGYAQVLEELSILDPPSSTVAVTAVYTYGHTLISQDRLDGATWRTSFYGYDGHNNVRYLTDVSGNVTDTYDYDAFGNLTAASGDTVNYYLFTGEQFDLDLGLYYLRARYHNPDTGRFWNMDSFEGYNSDPASLHKYNYCKNNPVNGFDPSGHDEIGFATTIAAGINFDFWGSINSLSFLYNVDLTPTTCGPDITGSLDETLRDVDAKIDAASKWKLTLIAHTLQLFGYNWDINPLYYLGRNTKERNTFVDGYFVGGTQGTGMGSGSVQYSYRGNPSRVYLSSGVNYVLWGHMYGYFHNVWPLDQEFDLDQAQSMILSYKSGVAVVHKFTGYGFAWDSSYVISALAFTKFGYDGTDPSAYCALPIASDKSNAAHSMIWPWHFQSLHSDGWVPEK